MNWELHASIMRINNPFYSCLVFMYCIFHCSSCFFSMWTCLLLCCYMSMCVLWDNKDKFEQQSSCHRGGLPICDKPPFPTFSWQKNNQSCTCCHGNPYMFYVALDAPCLSPQQSKLKRSWESIKRADSRQEGLRWAAAAVVEIHLRYPCSCLKMHRIMGIKGVPICPA